MRKGSEKLWQVENNLYVGERYLGEVEGKILYIPYGFYISDKTIAKLLKKYEVKGDTSYFDDFNLRKAA